MRSIPRPFPIFLAALALANFASAGEVTYTTTLANIPIGGSASTTLPAFDPSLGVLRTARLTNASSVTGMLGFENTSASSQSVGGYASGTYVGAGVFWQIGGSSGTPPNPAFIPPAVLLAAYDGTTDYGGASGVMHAFTDEYGDGGPVQTVDVYMDTGLAAFVGTGTVTAGVGPVVLFGPNVPPGIVSSATLTATARLSVRYFYDDFPTSICHAAPFSGCPCGNASPMGNGCGNSANANGGALASSGTPSISNDTFTLNASGMTNSNSLFFQGTSFAYAQVPYGDGLRCVTGSLLRLGTRTNMAGAAQVPSGGSTPISVQGQVTQPGTRTYQVFYRDAQNYCTSATYNVTSGLAILWGA